MKNLSGKRLLVLGGTQATVDIVKIAKSYGVYTIVTDYLETGAAKEIADETAMISTADIDALAEFAVQKKIDGVFTGANEFNIHNCITLCDRLNLPCYTTEQQFMTLGNKRLSKQLCINHEIPVSKEYSLSDDFLSEDLEEIQYPVLTKPVDSNGQQGISICYNPEDLKKGYEKAKRFSPTQNVIVEQYLSGDYIVIYFTLQNGNMTLTAVADKPVIDKEFANGFVRLAQAYVMPSKYIKDIDKKYTHKFQSLVQDLGMKNGCFSIEGIITEDKELHVFEMQYRFGGMKHYEFVAQENGFSILDMHISHALTGEFVGWNVAEVDNPYFNRYYAQLNLILKPGVIKSIQGIDEIKQLSGVTNIQVRKEQGDEIEASGTVNQIFAKISLVGDTKEQLYHLIRKICAFVSVKGIEDEELLIPTTFVH